jgi:hypothetical protein
LKLEKISLADLRDERSLWTYASLADRLAADPHVKGAVIYRVEDMCSGRLGEMKAVVYGYDLEHGLTCTTPEAVATKYPKLDVELASTIKWPVAYVEKDPPVEQPHPPAAEAADAPLPPLRRDGESA